MQERDVAIVVAVVILVILLLGLLGGGMMIGPMMGWGGYGPGVYGFGWWGILMLLFWALIIGGVVLLVLWLVRQARPPTVGPGPSGPRPLDILKERYARGEITREQYEEMRRNLEEGGG